MKKVLSLKELAALREETRQTIADVLEERCEPGKYYLAHQLEEMVEGLGSAFHFANTFNAQFNKSVVHYATDHQTLAFERRLRDRTQRCAYLDEHNNITGYFVMKMKPIYEYKLISVNRY